MTSDHIDECVNKNTQLNLANVQRNAARDYYEYIVPSSMKQLLVMSSKEELDRKALNNGHMFKYRFGFEPTFLARQKIIELQCKHEWSDQEVRDLHQTGNLRINRDHVQLKVYPFELATGIILIIITTLMCAFLFLLVHFSDAFVWKRVIAEFLIGSGFIITTRSFYQSFIAPWRLLTSSGAIAKK